MNTFTVQDAIERLEYYKQNATDMYSGHDEDKQTIKMAIGALKKEIQQKPIVIKYYSGRSPLDPVKEAYRCPSPTCKQKVYKYFSNMKYCPGCGQKLDWDKD